MDGSDAPPVLIEVPTDREAVVRQLLTLHDEIDAMAAPDGIVLDACEEHVLDGRLPPPSESVALADPMVLCGNQLPQGTGWTQNPESQL